MSNQPPQMPLPPSQPDFIPYAQPMMFLQFRDRRGGLKACGIILIILGALAGCGTLSMPLAILGTSMSANTTVWQSSRGFMMTSIIVAAVMYAAASTALIWTGIASIRHARWVRPVMIVFSVLSILTSLLSVVGMIVSIPALQKSTQLMNATWARAATTLPTTAPATLPPPAVAGAAIAGAWIGIIIGVMFVLIIGVVVPAIFFWFFRSDDTRLTLEYFDTRRRWTDGIPLPVLGVVITAALGASFTLFGSVQQSILYAGPGNTAGRMMAVISGNVLIAAMLIAAAVFSYRMRLIGWMLAVAAVVVGAVGWLVMITYSDLAAQLGAMGLDAEQTQMLGQMTVYQKSTQYISTLLFAALALGYLMWCRKFYTRPQEQAVMPV